MCFHFKKCSGTPINRIQLLPVHKTGIVLKRNMKLLIPRRHILQIGISVAEPFIIVMLGQHRQMMLERTAVVTDIAVVDQINLRRKRLQKRIRVEAGKSPAGDIEPRRIQHEPNLRIGQERIDQDVTVIPEEVMLQHDPLLKAVVQKVVF